MLLFQIQSFHLTCFTSEVLATYKMFELFLLSKIKCIFNQFKIDEYDEKILT